MIELHPNLENKYSCPVCDGPVELRGFIINGMRNLVDITCPACRRSFYADIPAGHGLLYPFTIDQETLEVFQPLNPFGDVLRLNCQHRRFDEVELNILRNLERDQIVLLNCLDFVYGHSLLKLLNVQYYLDNYAELGCCVLVPRQLTHLVPEGVAEIWEASIPLWEYRYWWVSLEEKIKAEITKRKKAYLAQAHSHPHHTTFSLARFVKVAGGKDGNLGKPTIVFSYRTDRLWGASLRKQRRNIIRLQQLLRKAYPEMTFALMGFADRFKFPPEIVDKRGDSFDPETEKSWLEILHNTHCVVGVFGSNMLLPTGLAECAVELLPEQFYPNILQDYLPRDDIVDHYENLFRFRVLYGNEQLTDVSPYRVAQVVSSQLTWWERFRALLHAGKPSQGSGRDESAPERIVEMHAKYRDLKEPSLGPPGRIAMPRRALWHARRIWAMIPFS